MNERDAGGSLPELLLAGVLAVLVLGIATNLVAGPVRALHGLLEPQHVVMDITQAGWELGSVAAGARAGLRERAVLVAQHDAIIFRVERGGEGGLRALVLVDGTLRSIDDQELLGAALLDSALLQEADGRVIVTSLDADRSRFEYVDANGVAVTGDDPTEIRHVIFAIGAARSGSGGRGLVRRDAVHVVELGSAHPLEVRR